jgi:hypothetical protein
MPVSGNNLVLNLDAKLQEVIYEAFGDYRGALVAVDPKTGGVLFGIRLVIEPLTKLLNNHEFIEGLGRAIQSMPENIAAYKGIASARARLLELLK